MNVAIGIDTSCYTTSLAVIDETGKNVASFRKLLPVPKNARGLRQSEAVFVHVKQLPFLYTQLQEWLNTNEANVVAIGVSNAPRPVENSYMPVFTTGASYAKILAETLKIPLIKTTHQQGHIEAGFIGTQRIDSPFLALHLSGGTTELLHVNKQQCTLIGGTKDLHAGQLVDRLGVKMGFSFPAGKELEQLALTCNTPFTSCLPVSMEDRDLFCHLSGAETKSLQILEKNQMENAQLALEIFDFLSRTVLRLLNAGSKITGTNKVLIVGGVASSTLLRNLLVLRQSKVKSNKLLIQFGKPEYSADNAVGVASIALREVLNNQ